MHPAIGELLELMDGEGGAEAREHSANCDLCRREIARISKLREELRALPPDRPERGVWPLIASKAAARDKRRRFGWLAAAALIAAACVLGVVFHLLRAGSAKQPAPAAAPSAQKASAQKAQAAGGAEPELSALIAQSQKLEKIVKKYEEKSPALSGRMAGAVANIQERIALIDLQIGLADDSNTPKERLLQLWKYRVQLLTSLAELHESRGAYVRI